MRPFDRPRGAWFVTVVVAAVSLFSPGVFAKPVVKEDAATAVSGWLKQPGRGLKAPIGNVVKEIAVFADAAGNPEYYVVYLKPSGFVIVPADDLVEPIICFSPAGKYVASDKNPLGALVMRDIPARLALARAKQPLGAARARLKDAQRKWGKFRVAAAAAGAPLQGNNGSMTNVSDIRVAPLIQTEWSQACAGDDTTIACYNYYTPPGPDGSSNNYVCGCVATAMAQLMYFWQYPTAGVGTASFLITVDGASEDASLRGGNGNGGPYDWADMVLVPDGSITPTQCQAIGALCYDAGVSVYMDYEGATGESGAYMTDASTALTNVFMYSNSICGGDGNDNIGAGLTTMLNSNLDGGLPCLLGISGSEGEHAIVADGYGYDSFTLYHHVNMGWSGLDNLWYNLPNIIAADGTSFTSVINCVYNIYTSGSGEIISGRVLDASGNPLSGATVQAVPNGGSTCTTTTNANGIYAFAKVPSASTYTLSATAPGLTYANLTAVTGTSANGNTTSGDVWGEDFLPIGTLIVQSTPLTGVSIGSSTGQSGTTNYVKAGIAYGANVNLQAPATDPAGYSFSQWTLNGTPQTLGQKSITFAMTVATTAVAQYTSIIYVKQKAAGANNGTSWTNAFTLLQSALNVAPPGAQIWVAAGTYTPTSDYGMGIGQQGFHFEMMNGVSIYGGFAGTETLISQRNWTTNVTTLTGQGNRYHVFYHDNSYNGLSLDATAVLDGFTITGGNANGPDYYFEDLCDGGGMYNYSCSPTITNCTFTGNSAGVLDGCGGGMCNVYSSPTVTNCTFSGNSANSHGGGGMCNEDGSSPTITNCTFSGNSGGGSFGGGGMLNDSSWPTVTNCTFSGNSAKSNGGGGMCNEDNSSPTITNCAFSGNSATSCGGGGMLNDSSWPTLTNCTFGGNWAGSYGGAMYNVDIASPTATNCVLWGDGASMNPEVYNNSSSTATFNCSDVAGSGGSGGGWNSSIGMDGGGNIAADPKFASPVAASSAPTTTGHYRLQFGSPCIDAGDSAAVPSGVTTDLDGNPRFVGTAVDMGAYEFQGTLNLAVQSTPITGVSIGSSTGQSGTTNYTMSGAEYGTTVNLAAPSTDPTGYAFSQWTLNGAPQTPGQKSLTFTMTTATTTVAQYSLIYMLTIQSLNPLSGVSITISPADNNGLSNGTTGTPTLTRTYSMGASVTLTAPLTVSGNSFQKWQKNGNDYSTSQTITVIAWTDTYTAVYLTPPAKYTLSVQSTPAGLSIGSSTGHGGATSYTKTGVAYGTSVNLQAPATDPAGYAFSQWTVNGAPQAPGQKTITFTMDAAVTAVAHYTVNTGYALAVQSMPPTGLSIGSSTGQGGTTSYTKAGVAYGTSVNLQAPATDPAGYAFSQWTVNGAPQAPGQKAITFTMGAAVTAVAHYMVSTGYALGVQSMPPTGLSIGSSTGQGGTTNYTKAGVAYGTSVNLQAPATDPAGYIFSQWIVNSAPQAPGQKAITFAMDAAVTAVAHYTVNAGYALAVQSTPTGLSIGSSTGQGGTTNYTKAGVAYGTSVNLQAPATDPAGYAFLQWTLNGAPQAPGQQAITFTMDGAMTAVAHYTVNTTYTLTVQSTPTGLSMGSSTGQSGTTNYTKTGVAYGTSVNLVAPATDPTGYTFSQWTVNGTAQAPGQKSIMFTLTGATTAVAQYTLNGYALTVQSTPATKLSIGSSTGHSGTTNYYMNKGVTQGASVNLVAPATDPAGYTFAQWTVNGAAQASGQKSIMFTVTGATTAVAQYTLNGYALAVQSTPVGLSIGSSTGQSGTTSYSVAGVAYGTSVNLQAPATDPAGYVFSQWTLNGAPQTDGQKSITFPMDAAVTAVAHYTVNAGYALAVQSTPPGTLVIGSSTGHGGTTSYTKAGVASGTSVNLQAPATDPAGYAFLQWTVNGAPQAPGQKAITFTMNAAVAAVAHYTVSPGYALGVQSTPTGLSIGSSTGQGGTTNYTKAGVAYGTSVNLQAPATDPAGYAFSQWTVNGAPQAPGQKAITFTMNAAVAAVAHYTVSPGYALGVQSTPTGLSIGSSTGQGGTTNYTKTGVAYGTSVNLVAPATDPAGYAFSQWTVNGAPQTDGQKSITFTMNGAVAAVAHYMVSTGYTLGVQSTPTGLSIGSSTGQGGTTNYTKTGVAYGTSVNLVAPATDPAGYAFSKWTVNGSAQTPGQKSVTFTMTAATTAVAVYVKGVSSAANFTNPAGQIAGVMMIQSPTARSTSTEGGGLPGNHIVPALKPEGSAPSPFSDVIVDDRDNSATKLFKQLSDKGAAPC